MSSTRTDLASTTTLGPSGAPGVSTVGMYASQLWTLASPEVSDWRAVPMGADIACVHDFLYLNVKGRARKCLHVTTVGISSEQ